MALEKNAIHGIMPKNANALNNTCIFIIKQANKKKFVCLSAQRTRQSFACELRIFSTFFSPSPTMPPKRPAPSNASGKEPKHQRKVLTLQEKVKVLDMLREGKRFAAVG